MWRHRTYTIVKIYVTERNDVIKRNINVITIRRTSAIEVTILLKHMRSEMKGVQEIESITGVRGWQKNPSLAITVWQHSASLVIPTVILGKDFSITKTCLYNFDPLKPRFYIVKLGFIWVYIIFLISAQKHRHWYSLEPPHRGGSNEHPQSMFWAEIRKNMRVFYLKIFSFWRWDCLFIWTGVFS